MSQTREPQPSMTPLSDLDQHLTYLKLPFMAQHYQEMATQAAHKQWSHLDYLATLAQGEADLRRDRSPARVRRCP